MLLFVGLGNPGEEYEKTRHNTGFMAIDKLRNSLGYSSAYNVSDWEFDKYSRAMVCSVKSSGDIKFLLIKPLTYMNKSGDAVGYYVNKYDIKAERDLVVFYDDLDIKLGEVKLTKGKNPKGHNGLKSIFRVIKKHDFLSVRIGIDNRGDADIPGEDYVLKKYAKDELEVLHESISEAVKKVRLNVEI